MMKETIYKSRGDVHLVNKIMFDTKETVIELNGGHCVFHDEKT